MDAHSALAVIDVDDATRRKIQAARANIASDANDRARVRIPEIDHLTDWVLIRPAPANQ